MTKTLVATPDPKRPRLVLVAWSNFDEWDGHSARRFSAWVQKSALKDFVGTLQITGAWDVEVSDAEV